MIILKIQAIQNNSMLRFVKKNLLFDELACYNFIRCDLSEKNHDLLMNTGVPSWMPLKVPDISIVTRLKPI